jgi:cell division septum initiation protein DivIVA
MQKEAEKILDNIIRLAERLDEEALQNADGVRFIELARSISSKRKRPYRRVNHDQKQYGPSEFPAAFESEAENKPARHPGHE